MCVHAKNVFPQQTFLTLVYVILCYIPHIYLSKVFPIFFRKQIFEDWVKTLPMLLLLAVLSYAGYHISVMAAQQEASRRMANLPFVLLSVNYSLPCVLIFLS